MPYNGSGAFTPSAADFPAVHNTVIESAKFNNTILDIAAGLSNAITKDGQSTPTGDIPFADNKLTGVKKGTAAADAATVANLQDQTGVYVGTVGGTAGAITLSPAAAIAAYAAGQKFVFIAGADCAGATTVAVSGLTAKDVTKNGAYALSAGEFVSGQLVTIIYDGTRFQIDVGTSAYIPPGSSVTVRSPQDKLREIHRSVKDDGAVSSTTVDSTTSFQACVDYCIANRIQTMFVPSAGALYYRVTDTITIAGRLNIVGDAEFTTTIWADGFTSGQPIFNFVNAVESVVAGALIQDITFRSDDGNATGVHIENIANVDMLRVTLYNLTDGIEVTGNQTFSLSFKQVKSVLIGGRTVRYYDFAGGGQHTFDTCSFTGVDGFFVESTAVLDSLTFLNCNFEQCDTTDFTCEGTIRALSVPSGRSEGFGGSVSFNINPSVGNFVRGYIHQGFDWVSDSGNAYCVGIGGDVEGFVIQANSADNIGQIAAVLLNGAGAAGIIQGNKFYDSPLVTNVNRAGVRVLSNNNSSGALPEYGGKHGTFTATGTGFSVAPTSSANYSIADGAIASVTIPALTGTSTATSFTITGLPAEARPARDIDLDGPASDNGGSLVPALIRVKTTGVIEVSSNLNGTAFTASGTKSSGALSLYYPLV